ncbi:flagellar M-ring protein FliF C-terminal domain-containing protein [Cupriavidus basilensis]
MRAQVTADVDFSIVEHTDESYKPNQDPDYTRPSAASKPQRIERLNQTKGRSTPPGGVLPGSAAGPAAGTCRSTDHRAQTPRAGQAPGQAGAPAQPQGAQAAQGQGAQGSSTSASNGPSSNRRDSTVNYELDRTVRHVQQAPGGVRRLSVAVVVNYRQQADARGKMVAQPLPPALLAQIQDLTREAMGFSGRPQRLDQCGEQPVHGRSRSDA